MRTKIARLSHAAAERTHATSKQKHMGKLKLLMDRQKHKSIELRPEGQARWVVNLSDKVLTSGQEEVLKLGLNFAPVPTKFPLQDTITGVEDAARKLPKDDATDLRTRVCGILRSSKLPKDNITKEHRTALKEMKAWKEEVILPADKGNATVIMKKEDYNGKLQELLSDPATYRKLNKDPTSTQEAKVSRVLKKLEKNNELPTNLYNRLRPTGSLPPRIYGLPKIHKPSTPLRPIVSCIKSPTYYLSKYIASVISPLAGQTDSYVSNSKHFVEMLEDVLVDDGETLVSFDVSSLFTNVPIGEAVDIIRGRLEEDEDLLERTPLSPGRVAELLQLCLRSTYFSFNGEFYEQREGAAMGSPVSAVVANLYMEFFEGLALSTAPARPRFWKRYVDDTFSIVKKGDVDELLGHLNSIRPSIKFTMELEKDGSIPFLDTRVTRQVEGKLDVTVYRKPTHTDRYLHFGSHHPTHVKKGLVRCLYDRARSITKEASNLKAEKAHLAGALQRNGYPTAFVKTASIESTPRERNPETEQGGGKPTIMMLPYVAGISERIRKACRSYDIRVVFRSGPTLRSMLTKVKDPLPAEKQANVVYEVPCTCGKVYIGETKRRLETRLKEHKDACVRGETAKSAIAEHAWSEDHPIDWSNTRILQHASHTMELVMKEALCIQSTPKDSRFNRDSGYELPDCWIALNRKLKGGALVGAPRASAGRTIS